MCAATRAPARVTCVLHGLTLWGIARGPPPTLVLRLSPLRWIPAVPDALVGEAPGAELARQPPHMDVYAS